MPVGEREEKQMMEDLEGMHCETMLPKRRHSETIYDPKENASIMCLIRVEVSYVMRRNWTARLFLHIGKNLSDSVLCRCIRCFHRIAIVFGTYNNNNNKTYSMARSYRRGCPRTFPWTDAFQGLYTFRRIGPCPHLSIALFALLGQFRPGLGLR
jgi:hypothetical protein